MIFLQGKLLKMLEDKLFQIKVEKLKLLIVYQIGLISISLLFIWDTEVIYQGKLMNYQLLYVMIEQ